MLRSVNQGNLGIGSSSGSAVCSGCCDSPNARQARESHELRFCPVARPLLLLQRGDILAELTSRVSAVPEYGASSDWSERRLVRLDSELTVVAETLSDMEMAYPDRSSGATSLSLETL